MTTNRSSGFHHGKVDDRDSLVDPYWSYRFHPSDLFRRSGHFSWVQTSFELIKAESDFVCTPESDTLVHALEPFLANDGLMITTFHDFRGQRPVSAANALITLWLTAGRGARADELVDAHETCLRIALHGFAPYDSSTRRRFRVLFLRQVHLDRDRLPASWLDHAAAEILQTTHELDERAELRALPRAIAPDLVNRRRAEPR